MAIPADLAPPAFSAAEVGLIFGLIFTIAAIGVLDTTRAPVVNLAGSVPLVGGALRSAVDNGFQAARNLLQTWLSAQLVAFSSLLSWLQTLWAHLSATVAGFAELTYAAVHKITFITLPYAVSTAMAQVGQQIAATEAYALGLVQAAGVAAAQLVALARADAAALVASARADASAGIAAAEAVVLLEVGKAEQDAGALVAAARAETLAEVATVTAYVDTRFSQSIAIGAAAEAALGGQLAGVAAQLGADLSSGVSALEQEIAKARALLSGQTVTAVAVVAADVAAIRALKCIQNCDPLGAIGEGFQMLDILAVLALIEAAQADPAGAQQWIGDNVRPAVEGLVGSVRAAL